MHPAWRRYTALTTLGLGLIVLAVATMLLGVRELVAVGNCASSPVFVSLRPCPDSVGALIVLVGAMPFLGAIGWVLYALRADRRSPAAWTEGPDWSLWWWPALFFGLGWQFVEVGRAFLADDQLGGAIGMGAAAATFAPMAAAPLLFTLRVLGRNLFGGAATGPVGGGTARAAAVGRAPTAAGGPRPVEVAVRVADALTGGIGRTMARAVAAAAEARAAARGDAPDDAATVDDIAGDLERLSALFGAGHLTEAEFADAKAQVLQRARGEGR